LLAIPLFTFAGYLLSESGAPGRLVRMTRAFIGWMPGGLAIVALATCAFFTAFTGASGVTIIALGALLYPALLEDGYGESFSLGLVTTSGSLGLLFAPSLPLILYGIVAQQSTIGAGVSIDRLFAAGLLPGLLMLVLLSAWAIWRNRKNRVPIKRSSRRQLLAAIRESIWEIPLPIVVLGGIYSGYFAVSEAATVTAVYVLVVEVFILREISWRELPTIIHKSMVLVGGIMLILGLSLASTTYMIDAGVPAHLFAFVKEHVSSPLTFLLLLNIFLLALGAILDIFSALVLVVPLILPVAIGFGIDPLHLGIIFLANMQLGYLTPPIGLNLFISSYRFEQPVTTIYKATVPFFIILLLSVLVITYWPALSLWLPGL
ncbi:MAG: TRAP transporter large permease subunit, partial [Desulfuromonadales bacterium]|nr:TRAP transporter large permease subunit [Desulfuromonadales bacterium]